MRFWPTMIAAAALAGASAASAQSPLDCSLAPQSVCADPELQALESERAALAAQLSAHDPQHPALAGEQTWLDSVRACGEDIACYRTAYLNHNKGLSAALPAAPGDAALSEPPLEAPEDAPTVEEQTAALDDVQGERLREAAKEARPSPPRAEGQVYVPQGLPGWGFFVAIGVTFALFWQLLQARARVRREVRAAEARLR